MALSGCIRNIELHHLSGWVFNETQEPLKVHLYINKNLIQSTIANKHLADIKNAGLHKTGNCGFEFLIPDYTFKDTDEIEVHCLGTKLSLSKHLERKKNKNILISNNKKQLNTNCYFFLHIPKTAGTSFKKMLATNFYKKEIFPNKKDIRINKGRYPNINDVLSNIDRINKTRLLLGHYPYIVHRALPNPTKVITFLRDPVQRVVSNLLHTQKNEVRFQKMSIEEIYNRAGHWHFQNLQTRFLCDHHDGISMRFTSNLKLGKPAVEKAIKNLEQLYFVGVTENFDLSIQKLKKISGLKFKKSVYVNKSKSQANVSAEFLRIIENDNELDIILYNKALEIFQSK